MRPRWKWWRCRGGIYYNHILDYVFLDSRLGKDREDILRSNPDINTVDHDLFSFTFSVAIFSVSVRSSVATNSIQHRNREQIALGDDEFAGLAVVVEDWGTGVEGRGGARLVVGEEDEGGGFRGCGEGFHCVVYGDVVVRRRFGCLGCC